MLQIVLSIIMCSFVFSLSKAEEPVSEKKVQWEDKFDPKNPPRAKKLANQCSKNEDCKLMAGSCGVVRSIPANMSKEEYDKTFEDGFCSNAYSDEIIKTYKAVCLNDQCDMQRIPNSLNQLDYYSCEIDTNCVLIVDGCQRIHSVKRNLTAEFQDLQIEKLNNCAAGRNRYVNTKIGKYEAKCVEHKCKSSLGAAETSSVCIAVSNKAECYLQKYKSLKKNPSEQEKLFLEAQKQAVLCTDIQATAKYLEIEKTIGGSASLEEYFSEALEKDLLQKNPSCLVKAMELASKDTRKRICSLLNHPMLLDKNEITEIKSKFQGSTGVGGLIFSCLKASVP